MAIQLTPEEFDRLNQYAEQMKVIRDAITKAQDAGLDTHALEANLARVDQVRIGLLRNFAPTSPAKP